MAMRAVRLPFIVSRTTPLHRCRQCYFSTTANSRSSSRQTKIPLVPPPTSPVSTPLSFEILDNPMFDIFVRPLSDITYDPLAYVPASAATPEKAEVYLQTLREGTLITSPKWEYYLSLDSTIKESQANEMLKYALDAKVVTPDRFFRYLYRFIRRSEWVSFHLGMNAMVQEGMKLNNYQYYALAKESYKDYNTVSRCASQINFAQSTSYQLTPALLDAAKFTVKHIEHTLLHQPNLQKEHTLRFLNRMPRQSLGTELYNVFIAHFNNKRNTAMTIALYDDMRRRNMLPNMTTYEIVCRGVTPLHLEKIRAEMKERGMVPSTVMYTKLMANCHRDFHHFYHICEEMKANKVPWDIYAYDTVIRINLSHDYKAEAFEYLRQMLQEDILPDYNIMELFFEAYKNTPTLEQLKLLWEEIVRKREAVEETKQANLQPIILVWKGGMVWRSEREGESEMRRLANAIYRNTLL